MSEEQPIEEPTPTTWTKTEIREIITIQGGNDKATNELAEKAAEALAGKADDDLAVTTNSYPYVQSRDLQDARDIMITRRILKSDADKLRLRRAPEGSVLLATARPETVGRCGIISQEAITNNVTWALIPKPDKILVDFLFYYFCLPSTRKILVDRLRNHGQPQLRHENVEDLSIWLPDPTTQEKIVRRLNSIIKEIRQSKAQIDEIGKKIALMREASVAKIFTALNQDPNLKRLPLKQIVTYGEPVSYAKEDPNLSRDFRYMSLGELKTGTLDLEEIKPLKEVASLPAKVYGLRPSSSTILYALINPAMKRVALSSNIGNDAYITYNTNIAALTVTHKKCDPAFCMWALIAAPLAQLASGNVIPRITRANLLNHSIPLPSSSEQKRVVDALNAMEKTLTEFQKSQIEQIQQLELLEKNVITQALQEKK